MDIETANRDASATGPKTSPEMLGAVGMSAVCAGMLAWAVWGSPPYAFFGIMKWAVAATCAYWALLLWQRSRALAPVSLLLLVAGGLHAFGEMRKEEWEPVNLATGVLLIAVAAGGLWPTAGKRGRWLIAGVVVCIGLVCGAKVAEEAMGPGVDWFWEPHFWHNPALPD